MESHKKGSLEPCMRGVAYLPCTNTSKTNNMLCMSSILHLKETCMKKKQKGHSSTYDFINKGVKDVTTELKLNPPPPSEDEQVFEDDPRAKNYNDNEVGKIITISQSMSILRSNIGSSLADVSERNVLNQYRKKKS
tara:strand:- start:494 stop:901 length:408 start_codon:yes stop_codon:yes gene_type:complete